MTGAEAEQLALAHLSAAGLKLAQRNYRCRLGEIDLIMQDGACLVFVEVRARASARFGGAAASITPRKQARLIAAAQHYLASLPRTPACRFDAVLIEGTRLEWLKDAFAAG